MIVHGLSRLPSISWISSPRNRPFGPRTLNQVLRGMDPSKRGKGLPNSPAEKSSNSPAFSGYGECSLVPFEPERLQNSP